MIKLWVTWALLFVCLAQPAAAERARLLQEDSEALQARVDLINQAKSEVLVEYFSVWNDEQSVAGLSLLLQAARNGKKVKIIMDALSNMVPTQLFAALLNNGKDFKSGEQNLEIRLYNKPSLFRLGKIMHRDHAKMLIVDHDRLITGGRNIGDKYFGLNRDRNFRDLDILTEGQVAARARDNFMEVWNSKLVKAPNLREFSAERLQVGYCETQYDRREECENQQRWAQKKYNEQIERIRSSLEKMKNHAPETPVDVDSKKDWLKGVADFPKVQFLSHQPGQLVDEDTNDMATSLMKLALRSKRSLDILSPYLVPTEGMIKIFQRLLDRGVRIRIITNSLNSTDNLFAQAGYKAAKADLIAMGIELYEYLGPDTAHAKVAVIDDRISVVGTYNLDPRSDDLNREVGVAVIAEEGNQLAKTLSDAIEDFRVNSILVGQDGKPQNEDKWDRGVSKKKIRLLKILMSILPIYREAI